MSLPLKSVMLIHNSTDRQRKRTRDAETMICRLIYFIENGACKSEIKDQLLLDAKALLGVRPVWKKRNGRNKSEELQP